MKQIRIIMVLMHQARKKLVKVLQSVWDKKRAMTKSKQHQAKKDMMDLCTKIISYIVDENTKGITSQSDLRFSNIDIFNIKSTTNIE